MFAFAGNPLDRASEKRADTAWLAAARADKGSRVLPLWKLQPLLLGPEDSKRSTELGFVEGALANGLGARDATEVFLGLEGTTAYFARDISALPDPLAAALAGLGHFRDARAAAALLPLQQVAIMGQAKALLDWHKSHGFCSRCGTATRLSEGGYRRVCPSCQAEHFPRTDPAVIMLVTARDHCLLGRNKRFAGGHYSTLAGFVEPGETIEEAVRREVFEEVGVRVNGVRYFATQPWPFPFSLMIGCFAEAETQEISVDGSEILTARWFDRETVRRLIGGQSNEISLPRREAIAFHLIRTWAEGELMALAERIEAIEADITTLAIDAIVNAANSALMPGGGVDGTIRKRAGKELNEELRLIGFCGEGDAIITSGYRLPAAYVIHTVAPIWSGGHDRATQEQTLARCYASALKLADENNVRTIAFPAIGTGAYRWPPDVAAKIAFDMVVQHLRQSELQSIVTFCCFARADCERYAAMIGALRD